MKLMCAARMAVPQALTRACRLAFELSRWSKDSGRKLYLLYCYLYCYPDLVPVGSFSTADREKIKVIAWPNADLNCDISSSMSTSGCFIEIAANGRSMPLAWWSRKQQCTATHTCEAETASLAEAVKEVITIQDLFEMALNYRVGAILKEDNSAALISTNKGYSPTMRGLKRTQRVSIGYIHDVISAPAEPGRGTIAVEKQATATHRGDMFTKSFDPGKYFSALKMIGVILFVGRPSRTKPPAAIKMDMSNLVENRMDKNKVIRTRRRRSMSRRPRPPSSSAATITRIPATTRRAPAPQRPARLGNPGRTSTSPSRGRVSLTFQNGSDFETDRILSCSRGLVYNIFVYLIHYKQRNLRLLHGNNRKYPLLCVESIYSSHIAEDFADRNPCLPDPHTTPVFRFQNLKMTRMSKLIRLKEPSVRVSSRLLLWLKTADRQRRTAQATAHAKERPASPPPRSAALLCRFPALLHPPLQLH